MNSGWKPEDGEETMSVPEALDLMWKKFLPHIRERAQLLIDAAQDASAGGLDQDDRDTARAVAHKLAGTLGMFGLGRGTELARELEGMYSGDKTVDADFARRADELAEEIREIIESRK